MNDNVIYVDFIQKRKIAAPLVIPKTVAQRKKIMNFANDVSLSLDKHGLNISQDILDNLFEPFVSAIFEFNFKK